MSAFIERLPSDRAIFMVGQPPLRLYTSGGPGEDLGDLGCCGNAVSMADFAHAMAKTRRPVRRRRSSAGLGDGFVIYPDAQTALRQPGAYGYLYTQNGQTYLSGPAGAMIVKSTQVFPDAQTALRQPGAYGYVYAQSGNYYLSGPYGPLQIRSPYTTSPAPTQPVLTLPPPPPPPPPAPAPTPAPAPAPAPAPTPAPAPAPVSCPTGQIRDPKNSQNCIPDPAIIQKQTQDAVNDLKARQDAGEIKVYAAPANGTCPDGYVKQTLPDGSVVCIDMIRQRSDALIEQVKQTNPGASVTVLPAGQTCPAGVASTTAPDGRVICVVAPPAPAPAPAPAPTPAPAPAPAPAPSPTVTTFSTPPMILDAGVVAPPAPTSAPPPAPAPAPTSVETPAPGGWSQGGGAWSESRSDSSSSESTDLTPPPPPPPPARPSWVGPVAVVGGVAITIGFIWLVSKRKKSA